MAPTHNREIPMDLTVLPIQQCPRSNIFALVYGEGGTGKGQFALRMAHRLTAPHEGLIVAIEADGDRMRHHAKRPDGTGFAWRSIMFPAANPDRLTKVVGELADAAEAAAVPVTVIIDGATRFWNDPGGFKDRAEEYGGKNSKGQAKLKGWGPVKAEERALYLNLRRLRRHAHILMCFEQTGEFVNQDQVGVKLDARKGITHEADFIFRMERHLKQEETAHETNLRKGAADVHRAIVEKTAIVKLRTKDDGLVDFHYAMPTGTVFVDPGPEVADLMLAELNGIADSVEAETAAYIEQLRGADKNTLRDAWDWVPSSWWPDDAKRAVRQQINELARNNQDPAAVPREAVPAKADYSWRDLGRDSSDAEWEEAGTHILDAEGDEVDAFAAHADNCARFDIVAKYIKARREELNAFEEVTGEVA